MHCSFINFYGAFFFPLRCRTHPEWDIRVTNVVQAAPELALTLYWFSNFFLHKSISETVCTSASWHGGLESKLTLFTGQLSNFDSNFLFCPHSDFSTSAFNRLCVYGCRVFQAPWGVFFMVTPALRSCQLCFITWFICASEEMQLFTVVCTQNLVRLLAHPSAELGWSRWGDVKEKNEKQVQKREAEKQKKQWLTLKKNASQLTFPRSSSVSSLFAPDITHNKTKWHCSAALQM